MKCSKGSCAIDVVVDAAFQPEHQTSRRRPFSSTYYRRRISHPHDYAIRLVCLLLFLVRDPYTTCKQVRHFEKYSRKGGRWSWKRPSYERDVVNLVKTERRIEEGIASALTEVDAVEAGLRYSSSCGCI